MEIYNQLNNRTHDAVITSSIINDSSSASFYGNTHFSFISHDQFKLFGNPNSVVNITLETLDPIVIENVISVEFKSCPPGFIYSSSSFRDATCECPNGNYNGYITCDTSSYSIKIRKASWIGLVDGFPNEYLAGLSPYVTTSSIDNYITLPKNLNDLSIVLCNDTNRQGALCGKCLDNYGVAINTARCVECSEHNTYYYWAFYLLAEILPVTIFFGSVFIFSMTITSGPLNSYIFFAQIITTALNINADGMIPQRATNIEAVYLIPYGIWNLNFFHSVLPEFCLSPNLNTVDVYLIGYVTAFYPLFLLLLFILILNLYNKGIRPVVCIVRPLHNCIARFRQLTNFQQSVTGGIAVFILISYTKIAYVSFLILSPVPLYFANGSIATYVFYPDGNIAWGKNSSVPYIIIASCILLTFVLFLPILLFYPTFLRLVEWISCKKLNLGRFYPSPKFQAFLNEFHGCYKDGCDGGLDCRWFASFYFFIRIVLFILYSFTYTWYNTYIFQLLFFLFVSFLFTVFQPYCKPWINRLDVAMFLNMIAITSLSQYNLEVVLTGNEHLKTWPFVIQYILILLPLLCCIGYYFVVIFYRIKSKWAPYLRKKYSRHNIESEQNIQDEFSYRDALVDSTHVPDFINFMDTTAGQRHIKLSSSYLWQSDENANEHTPLLTPTSQPTNYSSSSEVDTEKDTGNKTSDGEEYQTAHSISAHSDDNERGAVGTTTVYLP